MCFLSLRKLKVKHFQCHKYLSWLWLMLHCTQRSFILEQYFFVENLQFTKTLLMHTSVRKREWMEEWGRGDGMKKRVLLHAGGKVFELRKWHVKVFKTTLSIMSFWAAFSPRTKIREKTNEWKTIIRGNEITFQHWLESSNGNSNRHFPRTVQYLSILMLNV